LAAWAFTAAIVALTLGPVSPSPPMPVDHADKLWHALAFFAWAAVVTAGWRWPGWRVLVVAAAFGGAIELVQPLTGRDAELADLAADLAGAAAGLWLGLRLRVRVRRRQVRDKAA
ncbi:MAG: hypothetical protein K8F31_02950, partial [Roseovarius sp.]|nr:hypothetical protein [Roseovarius sp.]